MLRGLMKRWEEFPLRWKGIVLAVVPFVVLVLSASMALWGNRERQQTETALARHLALTDSLESVQFLIINAETGTRGYLLTRRSEFLDPFRRAQSELPEQKKKLEALVSSEPGAEPRQQKTVRLNRIEALLNAQMDNLTELQALKNPSSGVLLTNLAKSKSDMDKLRSELRLMRGEEEELLNERMDDITRVRNRDYIAVALTFLVGIIARGVWVYLFNTGINARLHKVLANIRARECGEALPHDATSTPDALGELEREIAALEEKSQVVKTRMNN